MTHPLLSTIFRNLGFFFSANMYLGFRVYWSFFCFCFGVSEMIIGVHARTLGEQDESEKERDCGVSWI